jgi:hypothetical protein
MVWTRWVEIPMDSEGPFEAALRGALKMPQALKEKQKKREASKPTHPALVTTKDRQIARTLMVPRCEHTTLPRRLSQSGWSER